MSGHTYQLERCVWEVTLKCNMRCLHCGSKAGIPRKNELSLRECMGIVDQLLDLKCNFVTFIGGEVFLYDGWERIARKLTDGGAGVNLITNGFLMGNAQLKQIKESKAVNVGVSVDGMKDNHDYIRNSKVSSFDRVLETFALLREEGISIGVVSTVMNLNFSDLEAMYELFCENGVEVWQLQLGNPMGNLEQRRQLILDPSKIPFITQFIKEKRLDRKIRLYAGDNIGYYDENEAYLRSDPGEIAVWNGCQAGVSVIGIDSVGNVKGCESIYSDQFIEGNIREKSLAEIWNNPENFAYNRKFEVNQLTGRCKGCEKGPVCRGGCRGSNFFMTGNLYENYFCQYNERK